MSLLYPVRHDNTTVKQNVKQYQRLNLAIINLMHYICIFPSVT